MLTRELIEQRTALVARMRASVDDGGPDWDAAQAELRALDARIERARAVDEADRAAAGTPVAQPAARLECRAFSGALSPVPADFRGSLWRTSEGLAVPALAPADRLVDFLPTMEGRGEGLGLSGYLRVLHSGARTPEEHRVLSGQTIGSGGATMPTELSAAMIDLMRSKLVAGQAGAVVVPMTTRQLRIARQTGDAVAAWRAEGANITESDPVFDQLLLDSKTLACRFSLTRELIEDGTNIEARCRNILANAMALALDRAVLIGAGTATEPLGIRGTAGIQSVSMGTNGATLASWGPVLDAARQLELANAGMVSAMVMSPRTARQINGFADTTGQWLQAPPRVASVPSYSTTSLPVNEVQGTSTDCSSIFLGDFSEVLIGMRTDLQISVLQERFAEVGQIGFVAWMRADVALARPAAMARILGIRP